MGKFIDLTGKKFGKLTVVSRGENRYGKPAWNCVCDCGNTKLASAKPLQNGDCGSCGCAHTDAAYKREFRGNRQRKPAEYRIWIGMNKRCTNPKEDSWPHYGGRGIKVCERWSGKDGFDNFFSDMGPRPSLKHSIERKDNNGNYCPENTTWADMKTQCRNRRSNVFIDHDGKRLCLTDWAKELGLDSTVIGSRVAYLRRKNLPLNLALYREGETPLQRMVAMGLTIKRLSQEKSAQVLSPKS